MTTTKMPEIKFLHGYSQRVRAQQHMYVESLWKIAQEMIDDDYWQDGTAEADAKAVRKLARNIARGQWKAAKRNLLSMDTSPRDEVIFVLDFIKIFL
jgi:hypothetical protein